MLKKKSIFRMYLVHFPDCIFISMGLEMAHNNVVQHILVLY